jgi:hypothetical protein
LEEQAWDQQIERDLSPGGPGAHLAETIDREIDLAITAGVLSTI